MGPTDWSQLGPLSAGDMEKECRKDGAAALPPLLVVLLIFTLAVVVSNSCAEARVFLPKRYHILPRTKYKDGGVASFPVPLRYLIGETYRLLLLNEVPYWGNL